MADILGYDNKNVGRIMSSDYALIKIDGEQIGLVQNVQAGYQHNVQPRFEAGSHHIYFVTGQGQGSISVGRSVGTKFLGFAGIDKAANGALIPVGLASAAGGNFQESFDGKEGDATALKFSGGVVQGISLQYNTGGLDVSENIQIVVGLLEK